jgi:hypothetical protein
LAITRPMMVGQPVPLGSRRHSRSPSPRRLRRMK